MSTRTRPNDANLSDATLRHIKRIGESFKKELLSGSGPTSEIVFQTVPGRVADALTRAGYPTYITPKVVEFWLLGESKKIPQADVAYSVIRREITKAIQNTDVFLGPNKALHRYCWDKETNHRCASSWVRFRLRPVARKQVTRRITCEMTNEVVDVDAACHGPNWCRYYAGVARNGDILCAWEDNNAD